MNKLIILLISIICSLILIVGGLYIKYVIINNNGHLSYLIKWIPTFLLAIQSFIMIIFHTYYRNKRFIKYSFFFTIGYICCVFGDVLLISNNRLIFIGGMVCFAAAYIMFGTARFGDVACRPMPNYFWKITCSFIIYVIIIASGLYYICSFIIDLNSSYTVANIMLILAYTLAMMYGGVITFAHALIYENTASYLSCSGMALFILSDLIIMIHDSKYNLMSLKIAEIIIYWCGMILLGLSTYQKIHIENIVEIIFKN